MEFPESPRVIYQKNPLVEVICQFRFPRILKIDTDLPSAFQERIRSRYPGLVEIPLAAPAAVPPAVARMLGVDPSVVAGQRAFDFSSADGAWKVSLTSTFLALTCGSYERWEHFKDHAGFAVGAFIEAYQPGRFERVGLRYRDVVSRAKLGLQNDHWTALLQPHILGELAKPGVETSALHAARELLLSLGENGDQVRLFHGFAKMQGSEELCYLIDADFFNEQGADHDRRDDVLVRLNRSAGRLFRWCITDKLHQAMDPQQVQ